MARVQYDTYWCGLHLPSNPMCFERIPADVLPRYSPPVSHFKTQLSGDDGEDQDVNVIDCGLSSVQRFGHVAPD
jgi:hypothetical protein